MSNIPTFEQVVRQLAPDYPDDLRLSCFDPGGTTGYARFIGTKLDGHMEISTKDLQAATHALNKVIHEDTPDFVVIEDYRVYSWKSKQHEWADLHTPKLVGTLRTLCDLAHIPYTLRMAHLAKGFATDDKLKAWGYYHRNSRHARDAVRHGIYQILFGKDDALRKRIMNGTPG